MTGANHILIVEDSATQAARLEHLLATRGFCVNVADDGEAAWELIQKEPPRVVVTDIMMPRMDGFEL